MSDLVTVRSFGSREAASIAADYLAQHGIQAVVTADDAGGLLPSLAYSGTGVSLMVLEADAERAGELLDEPA